MAADPPIVVVEGEVYDDSLSAITLVANGDRRLVPVVNGRFRQVLPIMVSTRFWAEAFQNGVPWRSSVVTVGREVGKTPGALMLVEGPDDTARQAELAVTWRGRPDRLEGSRSVTVNVVRDTSPIGPFTAFYVPGMLDGVYTFLLKSPAPLSSSVRSTLYLQSAGGIRLQALESGESRSRWLARVLLPQGTFWDDDDWFTGRSESVDTITKFRFPEGVSWIERKRFP